MERQRIVFFESGKSLLEFLTENYSIHRSGETRERAETKDGHEFWEKKESSWQTPFLKIPLSELRANGELPEIVDIINQYLQATG